jgi:hypothetical protein
MSQRKKVTEACFRDFDLGKIRAPLDESSVIRSDRRNGRSEDNGKNREFGSALSVCATGEKVITKTAGKH